MSQKELRITMLGKLEFGWGDGRSPKVFTADVALKYRALVCYLILNPRYHQREELATIFWPDKSKKMALANLRVALTALRGAGFSPYLDISKPEIIFNQQADYWCDVPTFESLVEHSRRLPQPDIPALIKAVNLYRGEFLAGFSQPDLAVFEGWMLGLRLRLEELMWYALDTIIQSSMKQTADFETGIRYAMRALELMPWRESAHQSLMWLLASTDQRAAALAQYERCREMLKIHLDAEPSPTTEELYVNIREMKTPNRSNSRPLPPLRPAADQQGPPFLAPLLPPFFLGRESAVGELAATLTTADKPVRLGIVGMGGIGKTTLALHLAHRLRSNFPDGVLWANVVDEPPEEIATRWAAAYGYDISQQKTSEARLAVIGEILADKHALLVLDDVWAGAKIRPLLPETGRCAVLITSRLERTVLSVAAEPVPLSQFSPENGRQLLLHHVDEKRAMDAPEALDEICTLVGNLPLAIDIAGSYLAFRPHRTLPDFVDQLKQQLKPLDLSDETQRIRETFELSWTYLDETQSRLFALLGLFGGRTFSLEAIAHIAQMDKYLVEDRLHDLVQLSLLSEGERGSRRYRQHALLAEFAQEKLSNATPMQARYVSYFADFAAQHAAAYQHLQPEWGNLETAVRYAQSAQLWPMVLHFTAVLKDAWFAQGRFEQARAAFDVAFQAAVRLEDEPQLAQNWLWWGQACLEQGDVDEGRRWLQQALNLYDELADGAGVANAEYELARIDIQQTLHEEAEARLNRVLALRQAHNDELGRAAALYRLARLRHRQGNDEAARALAEDAATRQRAAVDSLGHCRTLRLLVFILIPLNQLDLAQEYAEGSLRLAQSLQDLGEIAMAQKGLAFVYRLLDRFDEAHALANQSQASLVRMGDRQSAAEVCFLRCLIFRSEGKIAEAMQLIEECLAAFTRLNDALHMTYCLIHLGDFYNIFEDRATAVQKWHEARQIALGLNNDFVLSKIDERLNAPPPQSKG